VRHSSSRRARGGTPCRQRYPIGSAASDGSWAPGGPLAGCSSKLSRVIALASPAFTFTFGLLVTFLGIGVIANVLIAYAVVQVLGERQQNEEHRSKLDA
jgi:Flp pilus assembly protein TadB